MKLRYPDFVELYTGVKPLKRVFSVEKEIASDDVRIEFDLTEKGLKIFLTADTTPLRWLGVRFNFTPDEERREPVRILGDAFERAYGDLAWRGIEAGRVMPWYILVSNGTDANPDTKGRYTEGFGVKVQPSSIVTWQYDGAGATLWADVRCGGQGVILGGRRLEICEIVFGDYRDMSAFDAGRKFCSLMCPNPKLPDHKVYGSNNWYYAYGQSSHEEILADTKIVADQCKGLDNRPYMVIDDGWQKNPCNGPWTVTNERFPDMKKLASEMKAMGVRTGIWVRYLHDSQNEVVAADSPWRHPHDKAMLDPSHPEVLDYVARITRMFREWGFDLIKHDFTVRDICINFGYGMKDRMVKEDNWAFYDRSKTTAEITLNLYRVIKEAAGEDCVIIGCNTASHLCAGLYELNRTGDDTSGKEWRRTRKMGPNTLAFRMIQNGTFYMADADCVGIMTRKLTGEKLIPWEKNSQWLHLLSRSGSPLFVSCQPGALNEEEVATLRQAWAVNSVQANDCRPLDWMDNDCPRRWLMDGEEVTYDWYIETGVDNFRAM